MVEKAGRILRNKEQLLFENVKMVVETADKKRIKTIRVELIEQINDTNNQEN